MNRSEIDRLGERLRQQLTPEDLTLLDTYRRGFRDAYDMVVDRIRSELLLEVSGRPAKSTTAIVDKLRRGTMRFTQMQDISGCRLVVGSIADQDRISEKLASMFLATIMDRRAKPSHGYRAVHVIARIDEIPVEVQVRTTLQHVWAELSEKSADMFDAALKYGGGPSGRKMRESLS
jgi:putative GTP pyrophosphokinase